MLTIDATDPKSGTAEFKAAAVRIEKLARRRSDRRAAELRSERSWTSPTVDASRRRRARRGRRAARRAGLGLGGARERRARRALGARRPRRAERARDLLLPALHAAAGARRLDQPGALGYICQRLNVPPAEAYGVASFYALFALEPRPPVVVHVCDDIACTCNGGRSSCARSSSAASARPAQPSADGRDLAAQPVPRPVRARAGGAGHASPASDPREHAIGADRPPTLVRRALERMPIASRMPACAAAVAGPQAASCGCCAGSAASIPTSLDAYRAAGGYAALRRALELGPGGRDPRGHRRRS